LTNAMILIFEKCPPFRAPIVQRCCPWLCKGALHMAALLAASCLPQSMCGAEQAKTGQEARTIFPTTSAPSKQVGRTATIHWQRVPLGEAVARLKNSFAQAIFLDRRVDPEQRVSLDIEASSADDVLAAVAGERGLGVGRLGKLLYLGPSSAAAELRTLAAQHAAEIARLPGDLRASLQKKRPMAWPRLAEPRELVATLVQQVGWRLGNSEQIPHDLWAAGELPELTLAEQLTVLLIGFDLTFEIHAADRSIAVVPLAADALAQREARPGNRPAMQSKNARSPKGGRQVYTLRVQEQPVGAVLSALSKRLNWPVEIDEAAIQAAGRSLDKRVSFSVEQADQDQLLNALLEPAGLDFRREGQRVRIIPSRYGDK
jgi:hypothetical protein